MKQFLQQLLTVPDMNSRFVFLLQGVATVLLVAFLTVAFIVVKDRTGFPTMVGAVAGVLGGGAAAGRYFTKKLSVDEGKDKMSVEQGGNDANSTVYAK
jgi:hypothetical protein